jgi:glucokinase
VLSGPGLSNVYAFLRRSGEHPESARVADALAEADDPNVVITEHGLDGSDPLCAAALELFSEVYGAEAGNMALRHLATGGVFVGGGIAPKLLPVLANGSFMRGFADKGRFRDLLRSLDVRVALNPRAPLVGAAHYALRLVE